MGAPLATSPALIGRDFLTGDKNMAELKQTFDLKIWVNDKEYPATITFIDDGYYNVDPHPSIRLQSITIEPNKVTTVDLMECGYSWLLNGEQEEKIIEAIERQLKVDFYRGRDEDNSYGK